MKKKREKEGQKQKDQKQKEFSTRPFTPLKGLRTVPQSEPPAPRPPLPEPEQVEDDLELFLRAMADARKLHPAEGSGKSSGGKSATLKAARESEDQVTFLQALESLKLDVSFRDELPVEDGPTKVLGVNRLRQLKRGAIRLDMQLDLHGLTRDEALQGLETFIGSARKRGQKAVLVITGKGNRSPGEPVLQGAVTAWLRGKGKGMVAEFAPAPREMGGSGAFVVFLKEQLQKEGGQ